MLAATNQMHWKGVLMKKIPHVFSAFLCMILIFSASLCTAGAIDASDEVEGFTPQSTSTYGDLYRYFEPEKFAELPKDIQQAYDSMLLSEDTSTDDVSLAKVETLNWYLFLGTSTTKDAIDFTTIITIRPNVTISYAGVTVNLFDVESGKYVASFSDHGSDASIFSFDGKFTKLQSKHKYRISAGAAITLPAGYYGNTTATKTTTATTK